MDFNEVFIEGRLTDDALCTEMANGVTFATFTLACNEDKRRDDGQWQKRCQYVPVAIYGHYATALLPALRKSQRAIVLGKIEQRDSRFVINALKVRICEGTRKAAQDDESRGARAGDDPDDSRGRDRVLE